MKRGGPLKRTGGLTRSRMKPGKRKSKYALRERDLEFMRWVKTLPCLLVGEGPYSSVVEADHAGLDVGMGQKADDMTCVPLCSSHHLDRHACTGFFRGRGRLWKRSWRREAIAKTQQLHRDWFDETEMPGGLF